MTENEIMIIAQEISRNNGNVLSTPTLSKCGNGRHLPLPAAVINFLGANVKDKIALVYMHGGIMIRKATEEDLSNERF